MRSGTWVVLSALVAGLVVGRALTWRVRGDAAAWEARRSATEVRHARLKVVEAQVDGLEAVRSAIERGQRLVQRVQGDQAAAAALLSAMGTEWDARVERVSVNATGGEISGHADSPVAANEVGERLAARGLLADYDLRRFDNRAFTLAFTLPRKGATR